MAITIQSYQAGFEHAQARIGREAAQHWAWPFAYDLTDLQRITARPNFDPTTRLFCIENDEIIGYLFFDLSTDEEITTAHIEFPRMLPGHEAGAEMLMQTAFQRMQEKGVQRITGRVSTMAPDTIALAEKMGFTISDWGYKTYYSYGMAQGQLAGSACLAREIDPSSELKDCAQIAAHWYGRTAERCLPLLNEWQESGHILTHQGVWKGNQLVASCMAAPNMIRPSTAANYYIYAPDAPSLHALLQNVVSVCIHHGVKNLIADLVNEHRQFESVYQELGFHKVAEWGLCEKLLE